VLPALPTGTTETPAGTPAGTLRATAVLRVAPRSADTASALFVVAFQIGIGGGALVGSVLVDAGLLAGLCVTGAALATAGLLAVLAARQAFPPGLRPERLRRDCPPSG
jgi:predicted MFS family arabinose efflux permease